MSQLTDRSLRLVRNLLRQRAVVWILNCLLPGATLIRRFSDILDYGLAYQLWQSPFIRAKLQPIIARGDLRSCRRVLDIGCGPGINASFFAHADYTGLDWNERYIAYARQRYRRPFICADARTFQPAHGEEYDFVLANSFFHHIDDEGTDSILRQLNRTLTPDGAIHIVDLVLPKERGVGRWLALNDRGDFARELDDWRKLFGRRFEEVRFEPFELRLFGVGLWQMVYFKGRPLPVEKTADTSRLQQTTVSSVE